MTPPSPFAAPHCSLQPPIDAPPLRPFATGHPSSAATPPHLLPLLLPPAAAAAAHRPRLSAVAAATVDHPRPPAGTPRPPATTCCRRLSLSTPTPRRTPPATVHGRTSRLFIAPHPFPPLAALPSCSCALWSPAPPRHPPPLFSPAAVWSLPAASHFFPPPHPSRTREKCSSFQRTINRARRRHHPQSYQSVSL